MSNKVILSEDRQDRYNQAVKKLDEILLPEFVNSAHVNRTHSDAIIRHLNGAGVTLGSFLLEYFSERFSTATVANATPSGEYRCACNRTFGSLRALGGHKRTCKL
jgi:hypothetical protein